jgi:O-antigen/teichoic acid export membrane protein
VTTSRAARRASEKTDPVGDHVSRLFGRDSLYMLFSAVQLAAAAALTPAITRLLGPTEFGTVAVTLAVMQVLFVVGGFGLQTAMQREHETAGGGEAAAKLFALTIVLALASSAAFVTTAGLWGGPLGLADEVAALRMAALWAGASVVTHAGLALLRSHDRLAPFVLVSLVQSVVAEVASLGMVAWHGPTAEHFLQGRLVAQALAVALVVVLAPPKVFARHDRALVGAALRFALPLVPAALGNFALGSADRLILQSVAGPDAVARYQVAYNIASMPMLLLWVLTTAWMPRLFSLGREDERAAVLAASRDAVYRALMPVLFGLALGAPILLRLWAPPSYQSEDLLLVTSLVAVSAIPCAAQLSVARTLMTAGRTTAIAVTTLLASAANILLNVVMIPTGGLVGSAVATLVAYTVQWAILEAVARRSSPLPGVDWGLRLRLAGVCVAVLAAAFLPEGPVFLALRVVGLTVAGGLFLNLIRRINGWGSGLLYVGQHRGRPAGYQRRHAGRPGPRR